MEPTTQTPPAPPANAQPGNVQPGTAQQGSAQPESRTKPLPSTERDFHTRPSRTASPGFRIAVVVAVVVLLMVGIFVYRYVTSYESTDDAQVDGHINSISARITGHVMKLNVLDNQYVEAGTVLGGNRPGRLPGCLRRAPKPISKMLRPPRPRRA